MKVGFAFAVVIGVCLIGLGIYCLTWHHIQRMKGPMDPLEGVIFHKQFYRKDFSLLVERDMVDEVKPGPSNAVYEIKDEPSEVAEIAKEEYCPEVVPAVGKLRPPPSPIFEEPHPPPTPIYIEADSPHNGLVLAETALPQAEPPPKAAILELSVATLKPEPLTERTLMTTEPNGNSNPEDLYSSLPDVSEIYKPSVYHPKPKPVINDPTPKSKVRWGKIFGSVKTTKIQSLSANSQYGKSMSSVIARYQKQFLKGSLEKK